MRGGGEGMVESGVKPATLKFFSLETNNRNQTLHDVVYTFEEFIC